MKPKRCGRRFGKYCDKNKDLTISRDEFHQCLGKDLQKREFYRKYSINACQLCSNMFIFDLHSRFFLSIDFFLTYLLNILGTFNDIINYNEVTAYLFITNCWFFVCQLLFLRTNEIY